LEAAACDLEGAKRRHNFRKPEKGRSGGSGAPSGNRNAFKHGARSAEAWELRELIRQLGKSMEV
jgi:uncharacterized protein YjcR